MKIQKKVVKRMEISENGLAFIQAHEGLSLVWYELNDGGLTVGYGHYVPHSTAQKQGIKRGDKITREQAKEYLKQDIKKFSVGVINQLKHYRFEVNQNQFDALVSYAFNRGLGNSKGTNGLRQLLKNSRTINEIGKNMLVYWGTNKHYKNGLMNRRNAEKKLFENTVPRETKIEIKNEVDELEFSSPTLKDMYSERIKSPNTMELLDAKAVELLRHTSKLKNGKLTDGDMVAIALELAVHYAKEK